MSDIGKFAEQVNHPRHYMVGGIEVLAVLKAKLTEEEFRGYCKGNVLKYVMRAGHKDEELQDYQKARFYLEEIIKGLPENDK